MTDFKFHPGLNNNNKKKTQKTFARKVHEGFSQILYKETIQHAVVHIPAYSWRLKFTKNGEE